MTEGRDTQEDAPSSSSSARVSTGATSFDYSAFIIYGKEDEPFVKEFLVPALDLDPRGVLLCREFTPGAAITTEIARAVTKSAFTVAVLSPAYLRDRWARLTDEVAGYASGTGAKLVPLLLAQCDVPLSLKFRVMLDFRDKAQWPAEAKRLRDFLHSVPVRLHSGPPPRGSSVSLRTPGPPLALALDRRRLGRSHRPVVAALTLVAGCAALAGISAVRSYVAIILGLRTVMIVPDPLMLSIVDAHGYPPTCILERGERLASCRPYRWCIQIKGVGTFPMPKDGAFFGPFRPVAEVAGHPPASCSGLFVPTPAPDAQIELFQRRAGPDPIYDDCGPVPCVVAGPKGVTQCNVSRESCP